MRQPAPARRRLLVLLGSAGAGTLLQPSFALAQDARGIPACVVKPRQTDGPYFLDQRLMRRDIREDLSDGTLRPGLPLQLTLHLAKLDGDSCSPLADTLVDLWQCDARGEYAGVRDRLYDTRGKEYLRGAQRTDDSGSVRFTTIYPGWYPSRAVHIHIKARTQPDSDQGLEFATQLYFDDSLSDRIFTEPPYAGRDERPMRNRDDWIFQRNGGEQLILEPEEIPGESGLQADFAFALAS